MHAKLTFCLLIAISVVRSLATGSQRDALESNSKCSGGLLSKMVDLLVKEKFDRQTLMKENKGMKKELREIRKKLDSFNFNRTELKNELKLEVMNELKNSQFKAVAFTGGLPSNSPTINNGVTFKFSRVITDIGGGYDRSNGVFTCPVAGVYLVDLSITTNTCDWAHAYFVKNNHNIAIAYTGYHKSKWPSGSTALTIKLKVGDQIWIKSDRDCAWSNVSYLSIIRI